MMPITMTISGHASLSAYRWSARVISSLISGARSGLSRHRVTIIVAWTIVVTNPAIRSLLIETSTNIP